jgi:hypothetical protein
MMPHLGVLSQVNEQAAVEVFRKDCLVRLGTCIAASPAAKPGRPCMKYRLTLPGLGPVQGELTFGEMLRIPASEEEYAEVDIAPARGVDVGAGQSNRLLTQCRGGQVGIVLDARGRPLKLAEDEAERASQLAGWLRALDVYPQKASGRRR